MICPFCGTQNHPENTSCAACGFMFGTGARKGRDARPDWELHGGILKPASFFITVREVLFEPRATFRNLKPGNALFNAFLFALLGGTVAGAAGALWQLLARSADFFSLDSPVTRLLGDPESLFASLFLLPLGLAAGLFVLSGLIHLTLLLFKAASGGFATTFKVCAYSMGASSLLSIVPVLGGIAGFFVMNLLLLFGLQEAHRTSLRRILAALFIPFLLLLALIAALVIAFAVSGLALGFRELFGAW